MVKATLRRSTRANLTKAVRSDMSLPSARANPFGHAGARSRAYRMRLLFTLRARLTTIERDRRSTRDELHKRLDSKRRRKAYRAWGGNKKGARRK